jgi:hypothetical protein
MTGKTLTTLLFLISCVQVFSQTPISPYLKKNSNGTQLIVNGKPFIITGGELGNSSASSTAYMATPGRS